MINVLKKFSFENKKLISQKSFPDRIKVQRIWTFSKA